MVSNALNEKYKVLSASSPREALEIVKAVPQVDLVITDVEMSEMQGPDLLNEIKKIAPVAGLLMSGNGEIATRLPTGVQFLKKPFALRELHASVEAALTNETE
jgi:DNA-binding NtrC family response regulator